MSQKLWVPIIDLPELQEGSITDYANLMASPEADEQAYKIDIVSCAQDITRYDQYIAWFKLTHLDLDPQQDTQHTGSLTLEAPRTMKIEDKDSYDRLAVGGSIMLFLFGYVYHYAIISKEATDPEIGPFYIHTSVGYEPYFVPLRIYNQTEWAGGTEQLFIKDTAGGVPVVQFGVAPNAQSPGLISLSGTEGRAPRIVSIKTPRLTLNVPDVTGTGAIQAGQLLAPSIALGEEASEASFQEIVCDGQAHVDNIDGPIITSGIIHGLVNDKQYLRMTGSGSIEDTTGIVMESTANGPQLTINNYPGVGSAAMNISGATQGLRGGTSYALVPQIYNAYGNMFWEEGISSFVNNYKTGLFLVTLTANVWNFSGVPKQFIPKGTSARVYILTVSQEGSILTRSEFDTIPILLNIGNASTPQARDYFTISVQAVVYVAITQAIYFGIRVGNSSTQRFQLTRLLDETAIADNNFSITYMKGRQV